MDQLSFSFFVPATIGSRKRKGTIKEVKIVTLREVSDVYGQLNQPEQVVRFWRNAIEPSSWFDPEKEHLIAISLNAKLRIKAFSIVSIGLISQTLIHAREVFRPAIVVAASQIILAHNHPTGDPSPSSEDIRATRDMKKAGDLLGIPLLDSIIIGSAKGDAERYVSLKERRIVEG